MADTNVEFDGDVVIVTGAGRRLGRLYAIEFARAGARVVVDEITAAGGNAVAAIASVADASDAATIVDVGRTE